MSIASQLTALEGNIEDAYDMVAQRGGTMPQRKNMENLDDAIATIPSATTYTAGTGIDITGTTISIDDTVVAELTDIPGVMIGATSSAPGMGGTVPAPAAGDDTKFLSGDGTWKTAGGGATTMLYVSDMGRNPSSVTFYKDEQQTEAASAQFIKDAFDAGKVIIYDDEYYFFAEIVAASEDAYPGTDVTFKLASGWETASPGVGSSPEPEVRYIYYSSYASTTAEVTSVYLTQSFRGATSTHDGSKGYVPAPLTTDTNKFLKSNGTWAKVDSNSIDPAVLEYQPGDSIVIGDYNSGLYWTGRQRKTSTVKAIWSSIVLPKPVSSNVTSMTFTPSTSAYNECFSPNGTIYSIVNPTSSQLTFQLGKPSGGQTNVVKVVVNVVDTSWQDNMTANQMCSLNIQGTLTFN